MQIDITDPQRRLDMLKVLGRGLNTWSPDPPLWLIELYDELREAHAEGSRTTAAAAGLDAGGSLERVPKIEGEAEKTDDRLR